MNSVRGSTARPRERKIRREWKSAIALLALGLSLAGSGRASTLVLPDVLSHAPGGAIPLLTTSATLGAAILPASFVNARASVSDRTQWQLPLAFEPADANAPRDAGFMARGPGYSVFIGSGGALLALQGSQARDAPAHRPSSSRSLREARAPSVAGDRSPRSFRLVAMRLDGARTDVSARVENELPGRIHRLTGATPAMWQTQLRAHGRVVYPEVFPGVDVAYYGRGRELEYDFIVAPGADAGLARIRFDGIRTSQIDAQGDLRLETGAGTLVQRRPEAYQRGPEGRETVAASYVLNPDGSIGFQLGDYDRERTLVIDPVLSYSTFVGGSGLDQCWDIAVDDDGFAYVAGETESEVLSGLRIVSTNAFQTNYQGGLTSVAGDAFVAKLSPDGTAFEWFTYLGGSDLDGAFSLALGTGREPVVVGFTTSTNFPLSAGAFQTVLSGLTNRFTQRGLYDAFVTRLKADGSGLVMSTLYGGDGEDQAIDVVLAADQSVVIVGSTTSTNLPMAGTDGGAYLGSRDGFFAVVKADGTGLLSSRFLGGSARDSAEGIALNLAGDVAHIVGLTESTNFPVLAAMQGTNSGGFDAFVAGVRLADGSLEYASYLGGEADDYAYRVSVGVGGQVWFAGVTYSTTNLPVVASITATNSGFSDAWVARVAPEGRTLEMSSYFGGAADDSFWDVRADSMGRVHLTGETTSTLLPGLNTHSVFSTNQGLSEILIVRLEADGTPTTSLFGAPGDELGYAIAADAAGSIYVAGRVRSVAFPISSTNVAQPLFGGDRTDGFIFKLAYEPTLTAELAGHGVRLSWPAPNDGFALESAPATGPNGTWIRETAPVSTAERRHWVQLPMTATNCLFRLRWVR